MMLNGRVVYSTAGWIEGRIAGACWLCGKPFDVGAKVIRVGAQSVAGKWASTCCAARAEDLSGHWLLRPNAPRES